MSFVITGASGHLGRLVVDSLLEQGVAPREVVAGARDTARLADLAARGVTTTRLDYDDEATLSFSPGDVVLVVSGTEVGRRVAQHRAVIDAAARDGAARVLYTSAPRADATTLVLAPDHAATEAYLRASGLPFTILRNNWYTENYVPQLQQAAGTGSVLTSAGDGRVASASRADYAAGAAAAMTGAGHEGRTFELGGDTAWDVDELAAALTEVLGRDVVRRDVTTEEHVAALVDAGLDEGSAGFVAALDRNTREGTLAEVTGELSALIGRPTTPLAEGLRRAG